MDNMLFFHFITAEIQMQPVFPGRQGRGIFLQRLYNQGKTCYNLFHRDEWERCSIFPMQRAVRMVQARTGGNGRSPGSDTVKCGDWRT